MYTVDYHTEKSNAATKDLFQKFRERILAFGGDVKEEPKKFYIAYKRSTNFIDVVVNMGRYSGLKLALNLKSGTLKDPLKIARDMANPKSIGHFGNGDYEIKVNDDSNLDYIFNLIKQSYDYNT